MALRDRLILPHAKPATSATDKSTFERRVAGLVELAVAYSPAPLDLAAWHERSGIVEVDAGIPLEWAEAYALMQAIPIPRNIEQHAWRIIINDTGHFLDRWTVEALRAGWTTSDVFGLRARLPNGSAECTGIVMLIGGWEVTQLTADTITMTQPTGLSLTFSKSSAPDQATVWGCLR